MLEGSRLTSSHRLPLHLAHGFTLLLTTILLILGGVSGPGTGYWWVSVAYADSGKEFGGQEWDLGALGACRAGTKCTAGQLNPPLWKSIHAALSWHIAGREDPAQLSLLSLNITAGILFLCVSIVTYILILFPPPASISVHWWTLFLPLAGLLIPLITVIVDFAVRRSAIVNPDVVRVETEASFWLSILSLICGIFWATLSEYIRWLALKRAVAPPSPIHRPSRTKWDPWALWPWGKQPKSRREGRFDEA